MEPAAPANHLSDSAANHARRRRWNAQTVVALAALTLAVLALLVALRDEYRLRANARVREEVTVDDANAILERANDATSFANSLLSFLEASSAVVTVILVAVGYLFRSSIQDKLDSMQHFVEQSERRFAEREREFKDLEDTLTDQLDTARHNARNSIKVLSQVVLAEQQVRAHNVDTAIRTLQEAYDLDPDNQATNYLLGYLYTSRKQFAQAIDHLQHALRLEPDFTPAIAALGLALRRQGDSLSGPENRAERAMLWAQAESKLLEALKIDDSLTDADGESYWGTLGGLYRRQGRYDDALNAYQHAQVITPSSSYPISNLAVLHKHQGNDEEADRYFHHVLKAAAMQLDDDPRNTWARADYAQAKLVLGHPDEALAELQSVIEGSLGNYLLETVRGGLLFLSESPRPIPGLDTLIAALDRVLEARAERDAGDSD